MKVKRIACTLLAAVLCLALLAGCGSKNVNARKSMLIGTWTNEDGDELTIFKSDGTGCWKTDSYTDSFTWSMDKGDVLTIFDVRKVSFAFDEAAMEGDDSTWYMDGNALYLFGEKLTKK